MNKILIILAILSINLFSQEYSVIENENYIEIHFGIIFEGDSVLLPNYILDKQKENLKLDLVFQNQNDLEVLLNENKIYFDFNFKERYRGIDLYELSIPLNQIYNKSKLRIDFNKVNLSSKVKIESNLFPLVLNKQHLNYLLENKPKAKNKTKDFLNDDWFDRNKKYVKFKTDEERVYKLNTADVVKTLGNIQINRVGVKVYGNEYPYFHIKSQDNILDDTDEIYILGKVHRGDTTYYEHYNSHVSFYIYESDVVVTSLNEINKNNTNQVEFVNRDLHIEEDIVYSNGYDYRIVETDKNYYEGWYYSIIQGNNPSSNRFKNNLILYPNNIDLISLRYITFIELSPIIFNIYNLEFYQNNQKVDSILFTGFRKGDYEYNSDDLILGNNELEIYSERFINNKNQEEHGRLGVDYYNIKGSFYPVAINNNIDFNLSSNNDSYVEVSNFTNSNIVSIDKNNNSIQYISGEDKTLIAGEIASDNLFASITLNDNVISGSKKYFIIYKKEDNILKLNTDDNQEINQILNDNPSYFLLLNINDIDNNVKSNLGKFNLTTFQNSAYYFYSPNESKSSQFSSKSKFYELLNVDLNFYSAKISLNNGVGDYIVSSISDEGLSGEEIQFTNLESTDNQADVLYITSKELESSVREYLDYRKSTHPDLKFKVIYVEDIYNEFSSGIEGPHSLKKFLKHAYYNWQSPKFSYVYLIGETSWDYDMKSPSSVVKPLVPTYGLPVSDIWYTDIDTENSIREEFYISRITASNNNDLLTYLEKLKEFEKVKSAPWHKRSLLLIGGNAQEKGSFINYSENAFKEVYDTDIKVDTIMIESLPQEGFEISRGEEIRKELNNGVIWTNFIGHGSTTVFDMGGWNENQLNNFGRTGILSTLSCNTNAFGENSTLLSKNESYILYPKNGFIFTYGGTTIGVPGIQNLFLVDMMKALSDKNLKVRNVCQLKKIGTSQLQFGFDIHYLSFGTIGDPLIDLPFAKTYDFYFLDSDIRFENDNSLITIDDSVAKFSTTLYNNGYCSDSSIVIKIEHIVDNFSEIKYDTLSTMCSVLDYNFEINTKAFAGIHKVVLSIDSENNYQEDNEENNQTEITFNVFNRSLIPIDPKNNWNVNYNSVRFRFYDPNYYEGKIYNFSILDNDNLLKQSENNEIVIKDNSYITWEPNIELNKDNNYLLEYEFIDSNPNNIGKQVLKFNTSHFEENAASFVIENYNLVDLDINEKNEISISNEFNSYSFTTVNKYLTGTGNNTIILEIAGNKIIENFRASDGAYIFTLDRKTLDVKSTRHFYTFIDKNIANNFLNFVEDSLNVNDINFIAFVGLGFNVFLKSCNENEYCYIDNLKKLFKEKFESELIDSVGDIYDDYILVYSEDKFDNYKNENFTKLQESYFELEAIGKFQKEIINGSLEFEIPKDVDVLYSLELDGDNDDSFVNVYTFDIEGDLSKTFSVNDLKLKPKFDLDNNDSKVRINLTRENLKSNPRISNIILNYKPFPELGLKSKTILYDSLMRADDFRLEYEISNYSLRSDLDSTYLRLRNNSQLIDDIKIENLLFDDDTLISKDFVTDNLTTSNQYTARINLSNSSKELINNDNSVNYILNIFEDRESPILKAFANNSELFDQAFVSETSTFTINLYDNSNLEINDKSKFTRVRLNGWVEDNDIKFSNTFSENADPSLRASIQFTSNNLELGEFNTNLLEITAQDATGNETSIEYYLNITRKNKLDSLINYPNPFIDEFKLSFNYIGSIEPALAVISIFDINGKEVYKDKIDNVKIGNNEYSIRLDNVKGKSVSTGNYIIVIQLQNNLDRKSAIIQKSK